MREKTKKTIPIPDQSVEFLAVINAAEASLARSKGRPITQESMRHLAHDVKHRGRSRLAAILLTAHIQHFCYQGQSKAARFRRKSHWFFVVAVVVA
jgi:hypothetical protein